MRTTKIRRLIAFLLVLCFIGLALVACGDPEVDPEDTEETEEEEAKEAEEAPAEEEKPEEKPAPTSFNDMKSALDAIRARLKK